MDLSFTSVLLNESESISIAMRHEINSLLLKSQWERYLSIYLVNAILAREKFLHQDLSKFDNYLTGSNYVPFDNDMLTQSLLVLDDHHGGNNNNTAQYYCSINWPRIRKYLAFHLLWFQGLIATKDIQNYYG